MLFLKIEREKQTALLGNLKEKSCLTWNQIAKELKVNRSMIFFYLNGKCKIPKFRLEKLCRLVNVKPNALKFDFIKENKNVEKEIKIPKLNEELAEFLGILSGDGCLENNGYAITVTCGKRFDKQYMEEKVASLFNQLFGVFPKVFSKEGRIHCRTYSKKLRSFISEEFAFPIGEKKDKLKIPPEILTREALLKAFLRGLFDTDGGFHKHHKRSAQLQITSYSTEFRKQVWNALKQLGFKAGMTCENINIYDKQQIDKFFIEIGSNNARNLERYKAFKKTGIVPLQKEMARL